MVQLTRDYGLRGIALSGYGMEADFARTKDAGFLAHLTKPVDFERLNRVIDSPPLLDRSRGPLAPGDQLGLPSPLVNLADGVACAPFLLP